MTTIKRVGLAAACASALVAGASTAVQINGAGATVPSPIYSKWFAEYTRLTQPLSSLTVQVFTYATGPYEDWHRQAWAGALVLVTIVFACSLAARFATRR